MMQLKKLSGAFLAAGLMALSGLASAVDVATFNPSAGNGDPLNKTIYASQGAFTLSSIQTTLSSALDISSNTGAATWNESGVLVFNTYNSGPQYSGNRLFAAGKYDIYGTFLGTGGGSWTANQFNVSSITNFKIQLWASPNLGGAISITTPTSGTQALGGVSQGSKDFLLGLATFAGSFGGTNAQLGAGNTATTQLTANFNFAPDSVNYVGLGGYFQAPDPFLVTLNGSGSSNSGQSTYTINGSGAVQILTVAYLPSGAPGGATGNITLQAVPEPGELSLVGVALLAAGIARRRKVAASA